MTDLGDPGSYNGLQESLLERFIEAGGRMNVYQLGRGKGYSTFAIVQCLQQALTTDRNVVYIYDDKGWTPRQFCDVAMWFFDVAARWNPESAVLTLGEGKTIRLLKPDRFGDRLRGHRIHDVFGDVDARTIDDKEEFFYVLDACRSSSMDDGTGLNLFIIR